MNKLPDISSFHTEIWENIERRYIKKVDITGKLHHASYIYGPYKLLLSYLNGQIVSEEHKLNGHFHGEQRDWENGELVNIENFYHGKLHGIKIILPRSNTPYIEYFIHGKWVTKEEWHKHELIKELSGI